MKIRRDEAPNQPPLPGLPIIDRKNVPRTAGRNGAGQKEKVLPRHRCHDCGVLDGRDHHYDCRSLEARKKRVECSVDGCHRRYLDSLIGLCALHNAEALERADQQDWPIPVR